jgi:hypothetical protein
MARFRERGVPEREDYLVDVSHVIGRHIDSCKSLTVAEFRKYMQVTESVPATDNPF